MCQHVHAAGQRDLHLALLQPNGHSTVPGPCHTIKSPADSRKDLPQISLTMLVTRRCSSRPDRGVNRAQAEVVSGAPTTTETALTSGYLLVETRSPLPGPIRRRPRRE
jgi:hypothetical protein